MRRFNTTGPCWPDRHYMLPPLDRVSGDVLGLVDQGAYFLLHAPRQTGKTTLLHSLAERLTVDGRYAAIATSLELLATVTDVAKANELACARLQESARRLPEALRPPTIENTPAEARFGVTLARWAEQCERPVVLFLDEIDCLTEGVLLNVLRQLRSGYTEPSPFPHSVALVGLRDLRDFRVSARADSDSLGTASPFNVKAESLTLRSFRAAEIASLFAQHSAESGRSFLDPACTEVFALTQGQPWLVNAIARQLVEKDLPDPTVPVTATHVRESVERLIRRRDTHIDSLVDKLRDPRVQRVIEPILLGGLLAPDVLDDDLIYVRDLGLITIEPDVRIANPIYAEIIPRALTFVTQRTIPVPERAFVLPDGGLDMPGLLRAFQQFFRENAEAWLGRFDYREAGPHLVLMAFLQRVVNGGGRIQREFAIGSGRADVVVEFGGRRYVIELKLRYGDGTVDEGVSQLSRYLERIGEDGGWLVIFDRRATVSWEDKIFEQSAVVEGREIHIFGA